MHTMFMFRFSVIVYFCGVTYTLGRKSDINVIASNGLA